MGRNKPVLTFPIPGVPNATATATLDAKFMAESVVVKNGADTYEFTYSDYKDWNNPLHPAEAFYAGKMTEKKRRRRPRHYDDGDGNGTNVCRDARAGKRQGRDQANTSASQLDAVGERSARDADCSRRDAAPRRWEARPDRKLGRAVNPVTVMDPPMWPDAGEGWRNQPRVRLHKAGKKTSGWNTRGSRPRGLACSVARFTNPSSGTTFRNSIVDEQIRSCHDV